MPEEYVDMIIVYETPVGTISKTTNVFSKNSTQKIETMNLQPKKIVMVVDLIKSR